MKNKYQNDFLRWRWRMGMSRKEVAKQLGHKDTSMLARYENGSSVPPYFTAMRLGILYRIPSDFLYEATYLKMRDSIRGEETMSATLGQLALF